MSDGMSSVAADRRLPRKISLPMETIELIAIHDTGTHYALG